VRADLVISLGTNCEVTFQLRRVFRTERAYPFDWWITPLHVVAALLLNATLPHPSPG
jgi:hypothetical protein